MCSAPLAGLASVDTLTVLSCRRALPDERLVLLSTSARADNAIHTYLAFAPKSCGRMYKGALWPEWRGNARKRANCIVPKCRGRTTCALCRVFAMTARTRDVKITAVPKSRCSESLSAQRLEPKLHGQGPRAEANAARRLPPRSCGATTGELQPP
jgi:hypothetical protein